MRSGIKSLNTLNDAELVQFMKADFGSRYAIKAYSPSGYVDETVSINLEQGLYVARIHYHTLTASDFFNTY